MSFSAALLLSFVTPATFAAPTPTARESDEFSTAASDSDATQPHAPNPDDTQRLRGDALQREVRDLAIRKWPPPLQISFLVGSRWPLQALGAGLALEGYPTSWLRLSAVYTAGISPSHRTTVFSNYVETFAGLEVFGAESERAVDVLPQSRSSDRGERREPILQAWLPSYHALFVEVGMLSGLVSLASCGDGCPPDQDEDTLPVETRQLVFPTGGLRYVYFVSATSKRMKALDRRLLFQAYAHLIVRPLNDSGHELRWRNGAPVQRTPVGGRFGLEIPTCLSGCVSLSLELGYLPMPGSLLLQLGLT